GHAALGEILCHAGRFLPAHTHLEPGIARDAPGTDHSHAVQVPTVACLAYAAWALWHLGYPDQALGRSREACTLAQVLAHPLSLAIAMDFAGHVQQCRREGQAALEWADTALVIAREQGFPFWEASAMILRGWALAVQGQGDDGIGEINRGLPVFRATGSGIQWPSWLALLAEACGHSGQGAEGLQAVAEGLAVLQTTSERYYEAELHRLKGELTLQKFNVQGSKFKVATPQPLT